MIPTQLNLWGVIAGGETQEKRLHQSLAAARFRGEWFYVNAGLFRTIQHQIRTTPKFLPQTGLWQRYQTANKFRVLDVEFEDNGEVLEIPSPQQVFTDYDNGVI